MASNENELKQPDGRILPDKEVFYWNEYNGINKGDDIKIKGRRGKFKFDKYVENHDNGKSWFDFFDKNLMRRSDNPKNIVPIRKRKKK